MSRSLTPHAVIQPKPGIGDVIWHLPFIRAIAAVSPGGRVTFLAPPTSGAHELLAAEPAVAETIYFEQFRFGTAARHQSVQAGGTAAAMSLFQNLDPRPHHSSGARLSSSLASPSASASGFTGQRRFITNKRHPQSDFHNFPIEWLVRLMADMGVPFTVDRATLCASPDDNARAIGEKFARLATAVAGPRSWRIAPGQGLAGSVLDGIAERLCAGSPTVRFF